MKADAKLVLCRKYYYGNIDVEVFHVSSIKTIFHSWICVPTIPLGHQCRVVLQRCVSETEL